MPNWLRRSGPSTNPASGLSPDAPLHSLRYVILDTELTSLDHRTNPLLSIGAIAMQGPSIRLGEQFYRVVNPRPVVSKRLVVETRFQSCPNSANQGNVPPSLVSSRTYASLTLNWLER